MQPSHPSLHSPLSPPPRASHSSGTKGTALPPTSAGYAFQSSYSELQAVAAAEERWSGYAGVRSTGRATLPCGSSRPQRERAEIEAAREREQERRRVERARERVEQMLADRLAQPGFVQPLDGMRTRGPPLQLAADAIVRAHRTGRGRVRHSITRAAAARAVTSSRLAQAPSPKQHSGALSSWPHSRPADGHPRQTRVARAHPSAALAEEWRSAHETDSKAFGWNAVDSHAPMMCVFLDALATELAASESSEASLAAEIFALRLEVDASLMRESRLRAALDAQSVELAASLAAEADLRATMGRQGDLAGEPEQDVEVLRHQAGEASALRTCLTKAEHAAAAAEGARDQLAKQLAELAAQLNDATVRIAEESAAKHRLHDELQRLRRSAAAEREAAAASAADAARRLQKVESGYRTRLAAVRHANAQSRERERTARASAVRKEKAHYHTEAAVTLLADEHVATYRELEVRRGHPIQILWTGMVRLWDGTGLTCARRRRCSGGTGAHAVVQGMRALPAAEHF